MRLRHTLSLAALLGILAATAPAANAGPDPLWTASFDKDILWQELTPTGHLVVSSKEALVGINPETGATMWRMEELSGLKEASFDLIPLTQLATIQKGKGFLGAMNQMIVLDYVEGTVKWNSDKLDFQTSMGQFVLPEIEGLMIYGRNDKGQNSVLVVDLETGAKIWENKEFFEKRNPQLLQMSAVKMTLVGNQEPLFDTDATMITFMNNKAVRKWNAKTGERIWETEVKCKAAPALKSGYAPMLLNDDASVVYVPADMTVYAIRTADGSLAWQKPPKLRGMVYQMSLDANGLLVKGGPAGKKGDPFMVVLDPATGEKKWKKEFKKLENATNFVVHDESALVFTGKTLYAVSLSDGTPTEIARGIRFKGNEEPSRLSMLANNLYMSSPQNMMLLSPGGEPRYHAYHSAPGGGLLGKIVSTSALTAINAGSSMDAYARASAAASQSATGRGSATYTLITRNPYMSKRFKASTATHNYNYILTNVKTDDAKGVGLVKVNKTTGETETQIVLGEKEPIYDVDEIEGRLFFAKNKREIICYKL